MATYQEEIDWDIALSVGTRDVQPSRFLDIGDDELHVAFAQTEGELREELADLDVDDAAASDVEVDPQRPVLLVTTGELGACRATIEDVEMVGDGVLRITVASWVGGTKLFPGDPWPADGDCALVSSPRTWGVSLDGDDLPSGELTIEVANRQHGTEEFTVERDL